MSCSLMKGLGCCSRETGQRREPEPPHKMVGISFISRLEFSDKVWLVDDLARALPEDEFRARFYPNSGLKMVCASLNAAPTFPIRMGKLGVWNATATRLAEESNQPHPLYTCHAQARPLRHQKRWRVPPVEGRAAYAYADGRQKHLQVFLARFLDDRPAMFSFQHTLTL